ncbi:Phosphate-repressible phosphate permease [Tetrabaena socialis]|uniref:Phosphate transporter n=1 Tax=Tetrabaena socialis TaxID=47790 RepID=A0A2J7ZW27_9CHLO|nr:Phosphate-repressible phosphate permease [Tetrabaena socialis]|eukprot:PNH04464.1 Phosphate-repressible phosphate permease [Tetrabaena socialis]
MANFVMPEYTWFIVVGSMAAFAFGWGTGSNDVANAFGTSVGAKTLTLKQAVLIAICFEFTGALVLGRVSTATIAGGIAQISYFQREPEIYAYGMIIALAVGFVWQAGASFYELNVSATHSIIGAIMGFSLVYGGADAVNWATPDTSSFPPYKGVLPIILSWFVSPVLTGAAAAAIFLAVRTVVLRHADSYARTYWVLPLCVLITSFINIYFVFTKGAKKMIASSGNDWTDAKSAWIAAICAAGLCVLTIVVALPLLRYWATNKFARDEERARDLEIATRQVKSTPGSGSGSTSTSNSNPPNTTASNSTPPNTSTPKSSDSSSRFSQAMSVVKKAALHGMEVDIHKLVEEDPVVAAIHKNAEVFDYKSEYAFSYLQVFSACAVILAHGAGEVGYMAGPLATIWFAVKDGVLYAKVQAPIWCVLISALGLVIGLATYGYNVTRAMGTRMAKLSPSRGFAAELSTALVIMVASQYGLPTSSSQCITGGIVGLGMLEGKTGVNWWFFLKTFCSWVATLVVVGVVSAALFAQGVYVPSIPGNRAIATYETQLITTGQSIAKDLNATLFAYQHAADAGALTRLDPAHWASLNASLSAYTSAGKTLLTPAKVGTIHPPDAVAYLHRALALLQANSVLSLGQERVYGGAPACNSPALPASTTQSCPAPQLLTGLGAPYNGTAW